MTLTGKGRVAGVMGWPIGHSRSPKLHGYWLNTYGIDGAYVPLAVPPDRLRQAVRALPALGFRGVNVTVPHKEAVLDLVDRVDPVAQRIGAVNTIVVREDCTLEGRNTDAEGFLSNLCTGAPAWCAKQGPAVVVGAGGAARAVVAALVDAGVPEIRLFNRTPEKAERIARELGGPIRVIPTAILEEATLLVNTTTLGMTGQPPLVVDLTTLSKDAVVTDVVYTPLVTPLLSAAAARGNHTVDGLGMLLFQAVPGFEAWFGVRPTVTDALRAHVLGSAAL